MADVRQMHLEHDEILMKARELIAMEIDPEAFRPMTCTWDFPSELERRRDRQSLALRKSGTILKHIIQIMDKEYAQYFCGKAAQA